ncbi:MAG TPA: DUF2807 domain-containing protein [Bacteroidia bacterium]|nr:DUF2807 domain-containing protein [Bacteroidia bacterium]
MKRSYQFSLTLFLMLFALFANAQKHITLEQFTAIDLRGSLNAVYKLDSAWAIEVPEDNVTTQWNLENKTLVLNGAGSNIVVRSPDLEKINISGSGSLSAEDTMELHDLNIDISGSGKVKMNYVKAKNIEANMRGSGKIILGGSAQSLNANLAGSGKIITHKLNVDRAEVNVSGSGTASVWVSDSLTANIAGSGNLYYVSSPRTINQAIAGSGKIEPITPAIESELNSNSISVSTGNKSGTYWSGFELGFNGLYNSKSKFDTPDGYDFLEMIPEKSLAVNINFYEYEVKLIKRYVLASTGIGLSYNNYRFRKNMSLIPDTNALLYTLDTMNLRKNKLTVSYATVPVLLTFNSSSNLKKAFHITTGLLFSYKLGSHTKKVYNKDDKKEKDKTFDDFNIDPFRYDATIRIGYSDFTVFANYALSELFKSGKGPELHPWTIGISLLPW